MPRRALFLFTLCSLALRARAFDYCAQATAYQHPNASYTYRIPGIESSVNTTSPNGAWIITSPSSKNWTLTATFSATRNPSGQLALNTNVWLDDSSTNDDNSSTSRPYSGCAIAIPIPEPKTTQDGQSDDGDCSTVLGAECAAAYRKFYSNMASQYARRDQKAMRSQSWTEACTELGASLFHGALPAACSVVDSQGNGGPITSVPLDFERPNVGNCSTPASRNPVPILGLGNFYDAAPGNFSAYDARIRDIVPVMLNLFTNSSAEPQQPPWSDTRLVCMRAKDVAPGSRVPAPVASLAASMMYLEVWLGFGLVVALGLAFLF